MDQVLIVGAGPVGLSLGLSLARKGRKVAILDQRPGIPLDPRASTLQPPTLEMLEDWGVMSQVMRASKVVRQFQVWDWEGKPALLADIDYQRIAGDTPCPFRLHISQSALCHVLHDALEAVQPGAVRWGHKAVAVDERADYIGVTAETRDGHVALLEGDWLCACDGINSTIRKDVLIDYEGPEQHETFVVAHANPSVMRTLSERAGQRLAPVSYLYLREDWAMVMEMTDHVRMLFRTGPAEVGKMVGKQAMIARARALFGDEETDMRAAAMYRVSLRLAATMRAGRVLLAGDSAHSGYPVGGTAMNAGMQDAHHLAWAIEQGTDAALDRYSATRRAWARRYLLADTARSIDKLTAHWPWTRFFRKQATAAAVNTPAKERAYLLTVSMLGDRTGVS